AQNFLDLNLQGQLDLIDRVCGLSDWQKEKLRLAGRGDNKRILDGLHDLASQVETAEYDQADLEEAASSLTRRLNSPPAIRGPINTRLLKSIEATLTGEQRETF